MASEPFRISKANLVTLLNAIVGKAFGEFDSANALASSAKNKGRLGNVLEQGFRTLFITIFIIMELYKHHPFASV